MARRNGETYHHRTTFWAEQPRNKNRENKRLRTALVQNSLNSLSSPTGEQGAWQLGDTTWPYSENQLSNKCSPRHVAHEWKISAGTRTLRSVDVPVRDKLSCKKCSEVGPACRQELAAEAAKQKRYKSLRQMLFSVIQHIQEEGNDQPLLLMQVGSLFKTLGLSGSQVGIHGCQTTTAQARPER